VLWRWCPELLLLLQALERIGKVS